MISAAAARRTPGQAGRGEGRAVLDDFDELVGRHRGEIRLHCYRMLGSFTDAEDMAQETFLRAWRARDTFAGRSTVRAWLYRIATNACLDLLRRDPKYRLPAGSAPSELPWLEPYPDQLLELRGPAEDEPDALVVAKETVELAFVAAIQLLSANQRAVLILTDVLGWPAKQTAELLDTSVASVTSALQRGRATLRRELPEAALEWSPPALSADERALVARYVDAHERADTAAVVALLREDIRFTMPPQPVRYDGLAELTDFFTNAFSGRYGTFRVLPTRANRQPAAACYLKAPGESSYGAIGLDVLRFAGGRLVEITTFEPRLFRHFGLPESLAGDR
jgi:RNA polymerase sigma-70 factor, ECF subfamily